MAKERINIKEPRNLPAHVLVVDDEYENIRLIGQTLLEEGWTFSYAVTGKDALKLANTASFDLILLDVMMPGMDGFEVCTQLKENDDTMHIPVIFITALGERDDIIKGLEAGAQDYVIKPFHMRELLARARTQIDLYRQRLILEKMNMRMESSLSEKEKIIEEQKSEITGEAIILGHKNEMLDMLRKEMETILRKDLKNLQNRLNNYLQQLIDARTSKDKWMSFDRQFQIYHQETLNKLMKLSPDLSPTELRVCAFLLKGLSTKEIAFTMHGTLRSVEQARYRIRKKLNLDRKTNIVSYLNTVINAV